MIDTVPLGRHCGLTVPRLCMGTMNIGEPMSGSARRFFSVCVVNI